MKLFYNCSFFEEQKQKDTSFIVKQSELVLDSVVKGKHKFKKKEVNYRCKWKISNQFDNKKPCVLIPTKDNLDLLKYTLNNLKEFDITTKTNVVIIDDRSEQEIESLLEESISYLRVDNDKGFNFSMLNNIPAKLCYDLGCEIIILWNSDLWCNDAQALDILLKKHKDNNCTISGTKLIYPPQSMSLTGEVDNENIKTFFKDKLNGTWRNTVQFGGDFYNNHFHHYGRFKDPDEYRIDCDRPATFITGAFQIIDLKKFIAIGGLNPSLSKNYQDNDLCFKVVESGDKVFYFGKDYSFYHDESATMIENKLDNQFKSDQVLFGKIWNDRIKELL